MERILYLAGGCFWGVQKYFDLLPGVRSTQVGYANGGTERPSYREVCGGSGHAETVEIRFDADVLSLTQLLDAYFRVIDPFSVNRQGEDRGVQYRTGIYSSDPALLASARQYCAQKAAVLGRALAVEVLPLLNFYPAEEYHQKYLEKNPGGYCHIRF